LQIKDRIKQQKKVHVITKIKGGCSVTKVRCKVNNCYYWGKGEICQADNILVNNNTGDEMGNFGVDYIEDEYADEMSYAFDNEAVYELGLEMDRGELQGFNETVANTSQQTRCETMRPRHS
jgi:hypothetical protein